MSAPAVYKAITAIAGELSGAGIAKRHLNERDDYRYRSIDDVLNRLSPLLAKHRLCVLPRVLERTTSDRVGDGDLLLVGVTLKVAFDLVSSVDGSSHTVEAFGEALDGSDKATAKAMSSAYKHAMLQAFCVPVAQIDDADAGSYRLKRARSHQQEPVEGWATWASGITDIIESCATPEALERLQERQRPLLKALSREQPELYAQLGAAFAKRTAEVSGERCAMFSKASDGERCAISSATKSGERCANPKDVKVRPNTAQAVHKRSGARRAKSAGTTSGEAGAKPAQRSTKPGSTSSGGNKANTEATQPA